MVIQDVVEEVPAAKDLFDRASEILGYDLLKLCVEGMPVTSILHPLPHSCFAYLFVTCHNLHVTAAAVQAQRKDWIQLSSASLRFMLPAWQQLRSCARQKERLVAPHKLKSRLLVIRLITISTYWKSLMPFTLLPCRRLCKQRMLLLG